MGLAPGAHGSNRTGRPFTGDASGNFMYPVLYETGFANQPTATACGDGLELAICTSPPPPAVLRPTTSRCPQELANCAPFLDREIEGLSRLKVVVALGKIGFDAYLNFARRRGLVQSKAAMYLVTARSMPWPMARSCWLPTTPRTRTRRPESLPSPCFSTYSSKRPDWPINKSAGPSEPDHELSPERL